MAKISFFTRGNHEVRLKLFSSQNRSSIHRQSQFSLPNPVFHARVPDVNLPYPKEVVSSDILEFSCITCGKSFTSEEVRVNHVENKHYKIPESVNGFYKVFSGLLWLTFALGCLLSLNQLLNLSNISNNL